jgi:uncharacterized Fe-S cluster protein YjdI
MTTIKKYTEGDLTVIWQPEKCIHSEKCFKGMPEVFNPDRRPWIDPAAADPDAIRKQINACPSGALSYENMEPMDTEKNEVRIEVIPNGPLMVHSPRTLEKEGEEKHIGNKVSAFCRCGASSNKPFCYGSHRKISFEG